MPKLGQLGRQTRNTWEIFIRGAGKGGRQSNWTDRVKNEELLHKGEKEWNFLVPPPKKKKAM